MMTNNYSINLDIDIPHDNHEIVNKLINEIQEITDKYYGLPNNKLTIHELNNELEFLMGSNEDYRGILIKNTDFTETRIWNLQDILEQYKKYYPDRYDRDKETYTNIEVNNILFELKIVKAITGYECVAVPFDLPSHNDKIFDRSIRVSVPIINIGDIAEHEWIKSNVQHIGLKVDYDE